MKVEIITNFDNFLSLENTWNNLLKKSDNNIVFLTHEWFRCWWRGYEKGRKLFTLLIKDKGEVIGIVPLLLTNDLYRKRVKIKKICFLESGISPRIDFICLAGQKEVIIRCVVESLLENKELWDVARFNKIMVASETYNILKDTLKNKPIFFGINKSLQTPLISINSDWESYYATRSRKFRKVMRNKINRMKKRGKIEVERIQDKRNLEEILPTIFKISTKSWKAAEGTSIPSVEEQLIFYKELTSVGGERGWIDIWLLRSNQKAIAFEYHLRYGGKVYSIRADYDEEYKDISPGSFLEYNIIKSLFEESQIREYDFCGTDYQYTLNWTNEIKGHVDFMIFNSRRFSKLLGFTEYKIIPPLRKIKKLNLLRKDQ